MMKNYDNNPQVIQCKIQNFEKEIEILRKLLSETEDKGFYIKKIKKLEHEKHEYIEMIEGTNKAYYKKTYIESESNCIKRDLDDSFCTYVRNMIKAIVVMTKEDFEIEYSVLENKL